MPAPVNVDFKSHPKLHTQTHSLILSPLSSPPRITAKAGGQEAAECTPLEHVVVSNPLGHQAPPLTTHPPSTG